MCARCCNRVEIIWITQTEGGIRNKCKLAPNVFKNNFNEKFEKKTPKHCVHICTSPAGLLFEAVFLKLVGLLEPFVPRCSTPPMQNAPTHQITLNTDTQLYGVISIYKPKERQLSLCCASFFLSISISTSIFARRRKVFHKLSAALHCWRPFRLISNAYLHPAFKPSDGSQIKVSQRSIGGALVTLPTCWAWLLSATRASHRRQNKWHGNNGRYVPRASCTFRSAVELRGRGGTWWRGINSRSLQESLWLFS